MDTSATACLQKAVTVTLDDGQRMATVSWADGSDDPYPFVWLRDSCRCKACWSTSACHRLILLSEFDTKVSPNGAGVSDDGLGVTFDWPDGHQSTFDTNWLRERSFKIEKHLDIEDEPKKEWGSDFQTKIPRFNYDQIMSDDQQMLTCLESFTRYGLMVINNTPCNDKSTLAFGREIGFLKPTQYGYYGFKVHQKPQAINLAYTAVTIDAHVDLPSIKYVPEVQMLHCIRQAKGDGGVNGFADGFHVARIMREKYPREYQLLTTQKIAFLDKGKEDYEFHYRHSEPTICLDENGEPTKIRFFNCGRETKLDMSVEEVQPFFDALKLFQSLLIEGTVYHKMETGDMAIFHNVRVTHARSSFAAKEERYLEGAYMDWDIIFSKARVLREKLNRN